MKQRAMVAVVGVGLVATSWLVLQWNKPVDYGSKIQPLAQALIEGEVATVKRFLPSDTTKSYGITDAQLDQLIGGYLLPAYRSANPTIGKPTSTGFLKQGLTYITYQMPGKKPYISPLQITTNDLGFTIGLESLVTMAWGIRAYQQGLPTVEPSLLIIARQDIAALERFGMKGMADSVGTGKFYDWDEIIKRMETRMKKLNEAEQQTKETTNR
jgi:hypothetical protein